MKLPIPGKPVRGSRSGKPIMALLDLLSRRWALGLIWVLADGPQTFRGLQEKCDSVSPSVLNTRIQEMRAMALIERTDDGYDLTAQGRELFHLLKPLGPWAVEWAASLATPDSHADR